MQPLFAIYAIRYPKKGREISRIFASFDQILESKGSETGLRELYNSSGQVRARGQPGDAQSNKTRLHAPRFRGNVQRSFRALY